ncbi:LysR family transcriptional regulator [Marinobacter sp. SS21]|uniref:LysR family transcriptional regulator n=1 Tax=Marinobacter sp. SS21 TaxID=2979460 RepID=UPI00232F0831|nr:LysR family transcriptional regulator [Marinobacter sp. SS21]MDC0661487.1 LysR family transcriptional regulator [Marinobacter sp. SS21]
MDWNGLKSFLAIAQTGSLAAAARLLGVNHSTMFRRLKAFEAEIGGRLFDKIDQRYVLTAMGEELLEQGQAIADRFEQIERRIAGKDIQPQGTVRITAPYNLACRYLPQALADFRQSYPDIHIELLSSNLEINMNSRQADIAVRATSAPPEHLIGRKVGSIPWSVFGSPAYRLRFDHPGSPDQLSRHWLIGGSGAMANLPAFTWLDRQLGQRIVARSDELTAMSYLAETGHGLAFLPDDQARYGLERLFACPAAPASELWLLTHPDLRRVERIRLVMQHLTETFGRWAF